MRRDEAFPDLPEVCVSGPASPAQVAPALAERSGEAAFTRPFAAFALRRLDDPTRFHSFRYEHAARVAAMLRHVACQAARRDWPLPHDSARYVAGHGPREERGRFTPDNWPRFSYLPLPTLDPCDVPGVIEHVLIAEPLTRFGGDGRAAAWAADRLAGRSLRDARTGDRAALLELLTNADAILARYVSRRRPAREWVSVTPVILPGYDDARPAKRARLLRRCLGHAGYVDAVDEIESAPVAWGSRAAPPHRCLRPAYLSGLPALHVRVRFRAPVIGPVALGAGRHGGLGLLAAADAR